MATLVNLPESVVVTKRSLDSKSLFHSHDGCHIFRGKARYFKVFSETVVRGLLSPLGEAVKVSQNHVIRDSLAYLPVIGKGLSGNCNLSAHLLGSEAAMIFGTDCDFVIGHPYKEINNSGHSGFHLRMEIIGLSLGGFALVNGNSGSNDAGYKKADSGNRQPFVKSKLSVLVIFILFPLFLYLTVEFLYASVDDGSFIHGWRLLFGIICWVGGQVIVYLLLRIII